jgi:hypothetical protein
VTAIAENHDVAPSENLGIALGVEQVLIAQAIVGHLVSGSGVLGHKGGAFQARQITDPNLGKTFRQLPDDDAGGIAVRPIASYGQTQSSLCSRT